MREPGMVTTYQNGDTCPDGTPGTVQVFANGKKPDLATYIPQDGDRVKVVFGPPADSGQFEGETPTISPGADEGTSPPQSPPPSPSPERRVPPFIGDIWRAPIEVIVCGVRQPDAPEWESGVNTHGDGIIRIHPFANSEKRGSRGAAHKVVLIRRRKADRGRSARAGVRHRISQRRQMPDESRDAGRQGMVQVFANGQPVYGSANYIPQDGDQVKVVFGPAGENTGAWEGPVPTVQPGSID